MTNDDYDGVIVHLDGTMLITDGAEEIDDGAYACIAKNKMGESESQVQVTVHRGSTVDERNLQVCDYDPVKREFVESGHCTTGKPVEWRYPTESEQKESQKEDFPLDALRDCPVKCHCDGKTAFCDLINAKQLPQILPSSVDQLDFSDNLMERLESDLCGNFRRVKTIHLDSNYIDFIDSDAFQNCQALEKLTLKSNSISNLAPSQFDSLKNLTTLDLRQWFRYIIDINYII